MPVKRTMNKASEAGKPAKAGRDAGADQDASEGGPFTVTDPEQFQHFLDHLPALTAFIDKSGRYRLVNQPYADWVGISRGGILQKTVKDVVSAKTYRKIAPYITRALKGEAVTFELAMDFGPEDCRIVETTYLPSFDPEGSCSGFSAIVADRTIERRKEVALKESEARLRAVFENAPVEIYLKDLKGRYWLVSANFDRLFEGDGTVVGKTAHDIFSPDEARQLDEIDRQVLETEKTLEQEIVLEVGGRSRTYLLLKFPILNDDGQCEGVGAIATDITERTQAEDALKTARAELERRVEDRTLELKTANKALQESIENHVETEAALRENRALLEAVLNAASLRIDVRDAESRFLFINGHQAEALNVAPEEAIGKTPVELFGAEVGEYEMLQDMKAVESGRPLPHYEEEIPNDAGGLSTWLTAKVPIVADDGRVTYLVSTSLDVTDLKAREQELKLSQRMDAIGKLTGGIAHDFNNLLFVIGGNLQLLDEELTQDPETREKILAIKKAAKIGSDLTRSLLAFARQTPLSPRAVNISETIGGTVRVLLRTLSDDVFVETSFAEDVWSVLVDPSQLENAVLNLAVNARDAMPDGGQLEVRTENVSLRRGHRLTRSAGLEPGGYVKVSVADTGHGMTDAVLDRVFEPFFTTKEESAGTGLGLSMVYGFVHQSGGHVEIQSEVGVGTTVAMYLPRAEQIEDQDDASLEGRSVPATKGQKILVAEDDDDVRRVAVKMLERMGYEALAAEDGHAAIEILKLDDSIDLLFTDVVMPGGLNGRQLAMAAKEIRPDLPVLFASGYARSIIVEGGKIEEGVQILSKPYGPEDLSRSVRSILEENGD